MSNNDIEIEKKDLLPEKWRNSVYRFTAGGYDGCLCHPAALIVDGFGYAHLIGSDGGAGGLDENDWYMDSCRAWLDAHDVRLDSELAYGPKENHDAYREFQEYRETLRREQRRKERANVLEALESELERKEDVRWNHEFELIGMVDTPEKVEKTCRMVPAFLGSVGFRAGIADELRNAGYDNAGFVCSDCGGYVTSTDYESFSNCIDNDAYRGIGGVAVEFMRILCDDCRRFCECPSCYSLSLPTREDLEDGLKHMSFSNRFGYEFCGVCEGCWETFVWRHDKDSDRKMKRLPDDRKLEPLLDALESASKVENKEFDRAFLEELRKYRDHKVRFEGKSDSDAEKAVADQILADPDAAFEKIPYGFAKALAENAIAEIASDYWRSEGFLDGFVPNDVCKYLNETKGEHK